MDYPFVIFVVVGFLAAVLLLEGGFLLWNSYRGVEAQRMQRRLRALSADDPVAHESAIVKRRLLGEAPALHQLLLRLPRVQDLAGLLTQSGLTLNVSTFLMLTAAGAGAGLLVWMLLGLAPLAGLGCAAGGAMLPIMHALRKRRMRLKAIEQQLPDALEFMARAMRAGHAFASALQTLGTEGPEPIAQEFRAAFDEVNYGVPVQEALMKLATRVPLTDLRFFVIAVCIQRETGGNLAALLDKLGMLMRARFKLLGTIRVLSAEGRFSAWILTLLPFGLGAVLNVVNPKFMSVLWTDPAGIRLIVAAIVLMAIGIFWMRRIVKIRV